MNDLVSFQRHRVHRADFIDQLEDIITVGESYKRVASGEILFT